jgi:hypothetical protein
MAAALLLAACATEPTHRASSPARATVDSRACPDIDGTYLATAGHDSLVDVLNGENGIYYFKSAKRLGREWERKKDPYVTIQLRREGKRLYVTGTKTSGVTRSFRLKVPRTCHKSLLLVDSISIFDPALAAYVRTTFSLGRGDDGSLRVLKKESGVALVVLFRSESQWMAFPRVAALPATTPMPRAAGMPTAGR